MRVWQVKRVVGSDAELGISTEASLLICHCEEAE